MQAWTAALVEPPRIRGRRRRLFLMADNLSATAEAMLVSIIIALMHFSHQQFAMVSELKNSILQSQVFRFL